MHLTQILYNQVLNSWSVQSDWQSDFLFYLDIYIFFSEGIHQYLGAVEQLDFCKEILFQGPHLERYQLFLYLLNSAEFFNASYHRMTHFKVLLQPIYFDSFC